jgi:hypothetical protein
MKRISVLIVLVTAVFTATSTVALAADPTQADFDACNRMAQSKLSSPSASPQSQPQTDAKTRSSAAAPQAAPSPQTAGEARVANQADQLRGIAGTFKNDPTYQQAFRDCMKGRGF